MAGAKIPPPLRFSGWPRGIWNKGSEESVPLTETGTQQALRGAVNIDLDNAGKPRRRPGFELVESLPGLHSLWSHPRAPRMLAAQGNSLIAFDEDESGWGEPALAGPVGLPVAYALGSESVYFCNSAGSGMIGPEGEIGPWATECPGGQPDAAVDASVGGLDPGVYQVAITFVDAAGRESGATLPVEVEVPEGGGIRLSQFPVAVRPETAWARVYCSLPGGEDLFWVMDLPLPAAAALIGAHTPGAQLDKLFLSELPPGDCVAFHAGTLHSAAGNVHSWGEPLMHGLTRRSTSQARYDAKVTLLAPSGQGEDGGVFLCVAAGAGKSRGRTYFLAGSIAKNWRRGVVYANGAVPGTLTYIDAKDLDLQVKGEVPVWFTDQGQLVAGLPSGEVLELHGETYDGPTRAEHGATAIREIDGIKHIISVLKGGASATFGASDSADAEVWKNGVRIR